MNVLQYSAVGSPMIVVFIFMLGTIVGSFLNVVVYRLGTGEGVVRGRSRCFSCRKTLGFLELIPLFSFLLQKGRCYSCGSKISWQYFVVELIMGLVFMLIGWKVFLESGIWNLESDSIFEFVYFAIIFSLLLAISVYDFRHKIIPNQLVYPFIILTFLFGGFFTFGGEFRILNVIGNFISHTASGFFAFLFFASLWFFSKGRWMGFGDAKLALGMGFFLGPLLTVLASMFAFWIGALIAVPFVLIGGGGMKTQIPFGPFLAAALYIAWLVGEQILSWYFSFF